MISAASQHLLSDVFPQANLFEGFPQIHRRVVKWGAASPVVELPHSAVVASEETLLQRMERVLPSLPPSITTSPAEWSILSARPLPAPSEEIHFGARLGTATQVALVPNCPTETSWVESLANGWLFLLQGGAQNWLLSVGGPVQSLLAESSLIAPQILKLEGNGQSFPCHPRIAEPICGSGWLACGSAALGFDPLCGDGSGHAAREAILATAVVRAALQGGNINHLTAHYRARLIAGLHRHLETCAAFYQSAAGGGIWWDEQVRATEVGLQWCRPRIPANDQFKYRLEGFSLHALSS